MAISVKLHRVRVYLPPIEDVREKLVNYDPVTRDKNKLQLLGRFPLEGKSSRNNFEKKKKNSHGDFRFIVV